MSTDEWEDRVAALWADETVDDARRIALMRDLAADTVGILDALAIPSAHVVGRSTGGGIAVVA